MANGVSMAKSPAQTGRSGAIHQILMKRILLARSACLVVFMVLASPSFLFAEPIRSASELDYPPFAVVQPDGSADGFSVELLKAVAKAADLEITFYTGPWSEIKESLKNGEIDVLPLVSISSERNRYFDFSSPYLYMRGTVFVRKGSDRIKNLYDLKKSEIIVMQGDTAHEYALAYDISEKLILTNTYTEAMRLLSAGEHDAVFVQRLVGLQLLNQLGITNVVELEGSEGFFAGDDYRHLERIIPKFEQRFAFAVTEGNAALVQKLNAGLDVVKADGTYDRLYEKWILPLIPRPFPWAQVLKYTLITVVTLTFIFLVVGIRYLRNEVERRTSALLAAKADAEDATRLKDKFVSLVAHDLRSPIASILGLLTIVRNSDAPGSLSEKHNKMLDVVIDSCRRIEILIEDILKVSRIKTGRLMPKLRRVNIWFVATNVFQRHQDRAAGKGVSLLNRLPKDWEMYCDEALITEALDNLVSNAIKFTGRGDEIAVLLGDKENTILVADTGPGILGYSAEELFSYNTKTSSPSTEGEMGSGFGLPLANDIIAAHHGTLTFTSSAQRGTTFHIFLPNERPRILLVSAQKVTRVELRQYLREMEVEILVAKSEKEAVQIAHTSRPNLLVATVDMSRSEGVTFISGLRSSVDLHHIPMIAIVEEQDFQHDILQAGADECMTAPLTQENLKKHVRNFLG